MAGRHDLRTIAGMAVVASAAATLVHEGLGHGVTAWLRGDTPTTLTTNHLSSLRPDHWVEMGGTLANLAVGALAFGASTRAGDRANRRYFLWVFAALNLLPGAGYFLFSGILGVGDWQAVIRGVEHQAGWRAAMALGGGVLYIAVVRQLALAARPFLATPEAYNRVARWPYVVAGAFSCAAGAFDPLGLPLLVGSTIPAAFGGSSGLLWADVFLRREPAVDSPLTVGRAPGWWVIALVSGVVYIAVLGPGVQFGRS
jgi:hypothetical protein